MTPDNEKKKVEITASLMCINWLNAGAELKILEENGIDSLHWDIIDGTFIPDFTMGSSIIGTFRDASILPSNFHLMVLEPNRLFNAFPTRPNDVFIIHQECSRNLHRDLVALRRMGLRPGVAISPGTSLESLEYVIEEADVVVILTVDPGYKGQPLISQMIRKIERCRDMIQGLKIPTQIQVDGHVSPDHIADFVAAGGDILVGGSTGLFRKDTDLKTNIQIMREEIAKGLERRG